MIGTGVDRTAPGATEANRPVATNPQPAAEMMDSMAPRDDVSLRLQCMPAKRAAR